MVVVELSGPLLVHTPCPTPPTRATGLQSSGTITCPPAFPSFHTLLYGKHLPLRIPNHWKA
eukprot:44650-Chlamydomonas_euryale.AAC.1